MGQRPRPLSPAQSPLHFFGAELRYWREFRGCSQDALGRQVHLSGDAISKLEKALRWPQRSVAEALDCVLSTGGVLARLWPLVDAHRNGMLQLDDGTLRTTGPTSPTTSPGPVMAMWVDQEDNVWAQVDRRRFLVTVAGLAVGGDAAAHTSTARPNVTVDDAFRFASTVTDAWPDLRLVRPLPAFGVDWNVLFPGGRSMIGGEVAVQLHPARPGSGRTTMQVPDVRRVRELLRRPGRSLLVGAHHGVNAEHFYVLDVRTAARRIADDAAACELPVPAAYKLDDLTYGMLWAAANFDDALQADDRELTETLADLKKYERLSASAVSREAAPGLNPVAHMWLGSDFCARHILHALPGLPSLPAFWTRDQRGEEASAWLLFDHKYRYLRDTTRLLADSTTRAFCIPENAVRDSPRFERTLLFLAAALMESFAIRIQVTPDSSYTAVEGFVVAANEQAVIANWVRGDGIWHVDVTSRKAVIREFTDVATDVGAHSITEAPTARSRLQALASYLDLDWSWLGHRCAALSRRGVSGLIRVRSGRLSTAGLDAACAFVGSLLPHR